MKIQAALILTISTVSCTKVHLPPGCEKATKISAEAFWFKLVGVSDPPSSDHVYFLGIQSGKAFMKITSNIKGGWDWVDNYVYAEISEFSPDERKELFKLKPEPHQ